MSALQMREPAFVVELQVLVLSTGPLPDVQRLKEMSEALEKTARDYGGELVLSEVRWSK